MSKKRVFIATAIVVAIVAVIVLLVSAKAAGTVNSVEPISAEITETMRPEIDADVSDESTEHVASDNSLQQADNTIQQADNTIQQQNQEAETSNVTESASSGETSNTTEPASSGETPDQQTESEESGLDLDEGEWT